jgi:conjugative transfer signal peptidase TraF
MRHQRRSALIIVAVGAAVVLSLFLAGMWGGYRLNMTRSYPLGLWRIQALHHEPNLGDTVFICPPITPALALALARGYLPRGLCPSGTGPLIKTIVGVAGQEIAIDRRVRIDGRLLKNSDVQAVDTEGRALQAFAGGVIPAGNIFLHSNCPDSYDSRYFGPVPADGILGGAEAILTFTP